ncbi:MAG: sigma-70 family RNA polymerase sigma factor [Synechococcales bacterium]|nr:sigma-70 family RNA polymerase sigma factor [Synechococcales bacterium]
MSIPSFPEAHHPLIQALVQQSDHELLRQFQQHPEVGQFFIALFCRYSSLVYRLVQRSGRSPVQTDYLFALIWRHLFNELGGLDLDALVAEGSQFQAWLLRVTAACINMIALPPVEEINYDLAATSPPFWCYLDRALDEMSPTLRLMIVMAQTFNWSETRISAYLQAEGELIPPAEVRQQLDAGYRILEARLPEDVKTIYLPATLSR